MLKFPKPFCDHPKADLLAAYLQKKAAPIRPESKLKAPVLPLERTLAQALHGAGKGKYIMQGLEQIDDKLIQEEKGLEAVRQKTGQEKKARMSRLLLLANDGSDRFYRQAESLLNTHGYRLGLLLVDASSEELGKAWSFKARPSKAIMITDKTAIAKVLLRLTDDL